MTLPTMIILKKTIAVSSTVRIRLVSTKRSVQEANISGFGTFSDVTNAHSSLPRFTCTAVSLVIASADWIVLTIAYTIGDRRAYTRHGFAGSAFIGRNRAVA